MQSAALILTIISIYAALLTLGKVAAEAEARSLRHRRRGRLLQFPATWRLDEPAHREGANHGR
jgi:hypothetical protein